MDIKIDGFHGHLPMEVAQEIHYHFPATASEKNTLVLHMDTAIVTGQLLEKAKVSIEQGNFLQEMADRYQQDIQLVTSHEGIVGKPDTYTFLANERIRTPIEIIEHYIKDFEAALLQLEVQQDQERQASLMDKIHLLEAVKLDIELESEEEES